MTDGACPTIDVYARRARLRGIAQTWLLTVSSVTLAAAALAYPPGWHGLATLAMVCLAVFIWRWPFAAFVLVFGCTLLFEQHEFASFVPLTGRVPFFANLNTWTGVPLPVNPLEILLAVITLTWLAKKVVRRESTWAPNVFALPVAVFLASLFAGAALGLLRGGDWKVVGWELRGFAYLCLLVLVLPQLISRRRDVEALIWTSIGVIGIKAIQGVWRYAVVLRGELGKERAITAHEDALFIASLLVMLLAMLLLEGQRGQKAALAALSPAMILTFVATNRRVAYVALAVGLAVAFALVASDVRRRRALVVVGLALTLGATAYIGTFWSDSGPFGRPLRAVRSISSPTSTADIQSNYYRRAEEYNLIRTIRGDPVVGIGFGRPYDMAVQLSELGSNLQGHIAHNAILWLWSKAGTVGFVVFWMLVGSVIVTGTLLFRTLESGSLRAVALTAVALVIMQLVVSYADLQLTYYRNMVYLGTFIGILASAGGADGRGQHAALVG